MNVHRVFWSAVILSCALGACTGNSSSSDSATSAPEASGAPASPDDSVSAAPAGAATPLVSTSPAMVSVTPTSAATVTPTTAPTTAPATAAPTTAATFNPLASVHFTDLAGVYGADAIRQEAALGVFGTKTGAFRPYDPVPRGQYIVWLVTANNIYYANDPKSQIRLADPTSDQTFVDVPKSDPRFPQIEGMSDAGYVIGIDAKHFAPDRLLTREELIAIDVGRYRGGSPFDPVATLADICFQAKDVAKISKPYWGAFRDDTCGWGWRDDTHRIFGTMSELHPQRKVTRAEVAVALQSIAGQTAAQTLPTGP